MINYCSFLSLKKLFKSTNLSFTSSLKLRLCKIIFLVVRNKIWEGSTFQTQNVTKDLVKSMINSIKLISPIPRHYHRTSFPSDRPISILFTTLRQKVSSSDSRKFFHLILLCTIPLFITLSPFLPRRTATDIKSSYLLEDSTFNYAKE